MRIVILTDSLGRPRPDIENNEKTCYEDVYGYKLKTYFGSQHEIELLYIESLDTDDAIFWSQRMVAFREPDLVIYHLGVNDCVPRLFKKGGKSIIFNPIFRKITFDFFLRFMSFFRYFFTKLRRISYVSESDFLTNFKTMINENKKYNSNVKFIAVGIAKSQLHNKRSFSYNNNIDKYNKILEAIFGDFYIDIEPIVDEFGLIFDGVHLSKNAHAKLFEVIKRKIEDY
jgi:lysophospholipase L1-like esterase